MVRSLEIVQVEFLVLAAQAGDATAFEELLRRWLPVMRRHAVRLTGNAAVAEDVTQEACLALVGGILKLDDPARAHGWMLRVVTHKAADWVRGRRRERRMMDTVRNREPRDRESDCIEDESERNSRQESIREACRHLPLELRAVVSLYYGEGLSVAGIASAMGTPAGTIKSRLYEARAQIKAALERSDS